jgi:error-prone DNA polymerase
VQRSEEGVVHLMASRVHDRSAWLNDLQHDGRVSTALTVPRAAQPQDNDRRGRHPRDVRILPRSRDFH